MKLQKSTECALRILQYLYNNEHSGEVHSAGTIARATDMTYPNFVKIANQLRDGGYIASVQGRHGGYQLARADQKVSVYDVILVMQGALQISNAPLKKAPCNMQRYFSEVQDTLIDMLSQQYVADFSEIA